jgi:murein DD-endopeptidase MepM/ murein hydrolase activator NlpD
VLALEPISIASLRARFRTWVSAPARTVALALIVVAALSAGAGTSRGAPLQIAIATDEHASLALALVRSPCPPLTLPDGDACVRLPEDNAGGPEAESAPNGHHDRRGHWTAYDEIPRRPERLADYDAYRYPVPCNRDCVVSGYDLDRPDEMQRRGRRLSHVGHGAVDLPQKKGTPIVMVGLEHQEGDAEVVYVGPLFGTTLITRHTLREAGQLRDYLLLFGHLDAQASGIQAGARVKDGDIVGFVGDTGSPELVHLHLEARRVRSGVDVGKLAPAAMIGNENSVVCDPRNVLPRKSLP